MLGRNSDSKYLILWLCVALAAAIIVVGWVWALKFNFQKINAEIGTSGKTAEQAEKEVEEMFSKIEEAMEKSEKVLKNLEKPTAGGNETEKAPVEKENK